MKTINNYIDFIDEYNLDFLLEANIQFMPNFTKVIDNIESPISDVLLDIIGTDVDINTNFIDISDKNDFIKFIPDDKIDTLYYRLISTYDMYYTLSKNIQINNIYPIGNVSIPTDGVIGKVKELSKTELEDISTKNSLITSLDSNVVHFSWDDGNKNILLDKSTLVLDIDRYKTTEYKIGKFINKILGKVGHKFNAVDIEDFVNKYKAQMNIIKNKTDRFSVVYGEDIRKYYLEDSYLLNTGSLGKSCMRTESCQPFFDIYVQNSDKISLLILKQEDGYLEDYVDEDTGEVESILISDKITGRALIWLDSEGRRIMDRVYVNDSSDIEFFIQYAIMNKMYYKKNQDFNESTPLMFGGVVLEGRSKIVVNLKKGIDYDSYPYMDTLKFYNIEDGILCNFNDTKHADYTLEDIEGSPSSCTSCGDSGELSCHNCLEMGRIECPDCEDTRFEDCDFCKGRCNVDCPECYGGEEDCDFCKGKDSVICPECEGEGVIFCSKCLGLGDIICTTCNGKETLSCPECQ